MCRSSPGDALNATLRRWRRLQSPVSSGLFLFIAAIHSMYNSNLSSEHGLPCKTVNASFERAPVSRSFILGKFRTYGLFWCCTYIWIANGTEATVIYCLVVAYSIFPRIITEEAITSAVWGESSAITATIHCGIQRIQSKLTTIYRLCQSNTAERKSTHSSQI